MLKGQDEFFQTVNQPIIVAIYLCHKINCYTYWKFISIIYCNFQISKQNKHTNTNHDMKFNSGR